MVKLQTFINIILVQQVIQNVGRKKQKKDVDDQQHVETYLSIWKVLQYVLFYNMSSFYIGYVVVYFNTISYSTLEKLYDIPCEPGFGEGLLSSLIEIGAVLGGLIAQPVIFLFSRKHSYYFFNAIALIAGILVLIKNLNTLIIGRILQGICAGAYSSLVAIFTKQISPVQIYGTMGALQNTFFACGMTFGFLFTYILSQLNISSTGIWLTAFGFPLILLVIQQLLFLFHYKNQTPKYLVLKGRTDEARQIIDEIYQPEFRDSIYHNLLKDLEYDQNKQTSEDGESNRYPPTSWRAIFVAFFLSFFMHLSGMQAILVYGVDLAKGFAPNLSAKVPIYLNGMQLTAAIIAIWLTQKFSRRFLMTKMTFFLTISLVGLFLGFIIKDSHPQFSEIIILICFCLSVFSSFFSVMTMPWIYIPEIVQPGLIPIFFSTIWFMGALATLLFPIIRQSCGSPDCPIMFLFCSVCMAIQIVLCYLFLVETKEKTEHEVRELFNSRKLE